MLSPHKRPDDPILVKDRIWRPNFSKVPANLGLPQDFSDRPWWHLVRSDAFGAPENVFIQERAVIVALHSRGFDDFEEQLDIALSFAVSESNLMLDAVPDMYYFSLMAQYLLGHPWDAPSTNPPKDVKDLQERILGEFVRCAAITVTDAVKTEVRIRNEGLDRPDNFLVFTTDEWRNIIAMAGHIRSICKASNISIPDKMERGFRKIKDGSVHANGSVLVRVDHEEAEGLLSFGRWAIDDRFLKLMRTDEMDSIESLLTAIEKANP